MDIRSLIGMPLGYAKSVLEANKMAYSVTQTVSRSRFFACDEAAIYVIRATVAADGSVVLLVNYSLKKSDSVSDALSHGE